jgi:hypothetical protein
MYVALIVFVGSLSDVAVSVTLADVATEPDPSRPMKTGTGCEAPNLTAASAF